MGERTNLVVEFVVFLINRLARAWGKSTPETFALLDSCNAFDSYILPNWEVLHSQGTSCLVDDLTGYVRLRGGAV